MSGHFQTTGRLCGSTLIATSAFGQWLFDHGLSNAMVWIALAGLFLQVVTSLPALERSYLTVKDWLRRGPR